MPTLILRKLRMGKHRPKRRPKLKHRFRKANRPKTRNFDEPAYKAWRKEVYKRDGYKCQWPNCNGKGKVYAHHILIWSKYPGLRFSLNNGITLCYKHHKQVTGEEENYVRLFSEILLQKLRKKDANNS